MNLARYVPDRYVEPAWHQALRTFMDQAAAGTARGVVNNVMQPDYTQQATNAGLVNPDDEAARQTWLGRAVQGPQWTRQEYMDAMNRMASENLLNEQAGREDDRTTAIGNAENERASEEKEHERHNQALESVEAKRYEEEHADRMDRNKSMAAAEADRTAKEGTDALLKTTTMAAKDWNPKPDPRMVEVQTRKQLADWIMGGMKGPQPGSVDSTAAPQNAASTDPHQSVSPTVPGSSPSPIDAASIMSQMPGYGGANGMPNSTPPVQPSGGVQTINPASSPSAATPGQEGQAPGSMDTPGNSMPSVIDINSLLAPQNQMRQGMGQQGGSPLMGIPAHPLGMSMPATAPGGVVPSNYMDPRILQAAYALARSKGQPQGFGGTPGTGGLPLGYG